MHHPRLALLAVPVAVSLLGCAGAVPNEALIAEFQAARAAALSLPGPAGANWQPDAILQLSPSALEAVVALGIGQIQTKEWKVDAPGLTLTPKLKLDSAQLEASKVCDSCFVTTAVVKGPLAYDAGFLGKGSIPTQIEATIDLQLTVGTQKEGFPVTVAVRDVQRVRVELEGLPKALADAIEPRLTAVARDEIATRLQPFEVAKPPKDALPLRALRVVPQGSGVRLEMLTMAGTPEPVKATKMQGDWTLDIASTSLVALAARESFKAGPQKLGLVGEPKALRIDNDALQVDLRVWRTDGAGWWRDITVKGTAAVGPRNVKLKATSVDVSAQSDGAAWADPMAWLAESTLLGQVEQIAEFALPALESTKIGETEAKVKLEGLSGGPNRVRTWGTASFE